MEKILSCCLTKTLSTCQVSRTTCVAPHIKTGLEFNILLQTTGRGGRQAVHGIRLFNTSHKTTITTTRWNSNHYYNIITIMWIDPWLPRQTLTYHLVPSAAVGPALNYTDLLHSSVSPGPAPELRTLHHNTGRPSQVSSLGTHTFLYSFSSPGQRSNLLHL